MSRFDSLDAGQRRRLAFGPRDEGRDGAFVSACPDQHAFRINKNLASETQFTPHPPDCGAEAYALYPSAYADFHCVTTPQLETSGEPVFLFHPCANERGP